MSKVLVNDANLSAIAGAIREKNGEETQYKPSEMAEAIRNLPSGGGGGGSRPWSYYTFHQTGSSNTNSMTLPDELQDLTKIFMILNPQDNASTYSFVGIKNDMFNLPNDYSLVCLREGVIEVGYPYFVMPLPDNIVIPVTYAAKANKDNGLILQLVNNSGRLQINCINLAEEVQKSRVEFIGGRSTVYIFYYTD